MPASPTTQRMGELHEIHLAEVLGGTKTKSSGNQWSDPMDGKNHADLPWSFRWDGKSTRGKQIAVTLDMIAKAREQAGTRYPALGLRWYANDTLTDVTEEWTAFPDEVTAELLADARETAQLREELKHAREHERVSQEHIEELRAQVAALSEQLAVTGPGETPVPVERDVPEYVPELPWTVVTRRGTDCAGLRYGRDGSMTPFAVVEARIERSPDSANRPRLIVNGARVERGDLYLDGRLVCRAWPDHPDRETG
jgi:hypothetical protein